MAPRIYDENEQRRIIKDMRSNAAFSDKVLRIAFLAVSALLVGASLFMLGRVLAAPQRSLAAAEGRLSSESVNGNTSSAQQVVAHLVTLLTTLWGTLELWNFRPDRDYKAFLHNVSSFHFATHGAIVIQCVALCVQIAISWWLHPSRNDREDLLHMLFHDAASSVLGLVHAACAYYLREWMSSTQQQLDTLETKKYQISSV